jgi:CBS domain-containing protein
MYEDIVVSKIMNREPIFIHKDRNVEEVFRIIIENYINGIPVIDDEHHIVGIITQGDLLLKAIESPLFSLWSHGVYDSTEDVLKEYLKINSTRVDEIMTKAPLCIHEDEMISKAAEIMYKNKVKQLPVLRNGTLVGIISRIDIIKYIFIKK